MKGRKREIRYDLRKPKQRDDSSSARVQETIEPFRHDFCGGKTHDLPSIQNGLEIAAFDTLQEKLGVSSERLSALLGLGRSTLHRRRQTGFLTKGESDRLNRYLRLFEQAMYVFEDEAEAREWLKAEAYAFHWQTPLDHADTETGARDVEALLWRLESGVYS